jgi:UDP-glucose 4-epimerase
MKIAVIGGSGFIGGHVVDSLLKANHKVVIYDKKKSQVNSKKCKFVLGNISNKKKLSKATKGCEIVYNFAALADIDEARHKPFETIKVNIEGTLKILEICRINKIKKIIHASSIYANSKEGGYYSISKRSAEDYLDEYCKKNNLGFVILRFGSLYGDRADDNNGIQRIVNTMLKKNELIYRGEKKAARKYINVKDAANYCVKILDKKYANKYLNITGNKTIKIKNFLKKLSAKYKIKTIKFLNEKNTSHYNVQPTPYKMRMSKNLYIKNEKDFYKSIFQLINKGKK